MGLAVDVLVEVEDVRLDADGALAGEGRVRADADRRAFRAHAGRQDDVAGVDALGRNDVAVRQADVRGRDAELPAAAVAADDGALEPGRMAEQAAAHLDLAALHVGTDAGRRHRLAADLDERRDGDVEAALAAELREQRRVAARPWPKRKFAPTTIPTAPKRPTRTSSTNSCAVRSASGA